MANLNRLQDFLDNSLSLPRRSIRSERSLFRFAAIVIHAEKDAHKLHLFAGMFLYVRGVCLDFHVLEGEVQSVRNPETRCLYRCDVQRYAPHVHCSLFDVER